MYEEGILNQDLGFTRPKYIVMEGLKKKAEELGRVRSSFDFTYEYPKQETIAQDDRTGQTAVRRRVVIKKVQSVPKVKGIGQIYSGEMYMDENQIAALEAEGIGQVDTHTIEISVWSPDSTDRDMLIDLIKIWMLELNRNKEESGLPFFYEKGIYAVEEVRNYESIDRGNVSTHFHVGIIVYDLLCPFYGVHTDQLMRFKYDIINKIIDNTTGPVSPGDGEPTTYPGEIIFVPNPPGTPPAGGGGGSGGGSGVPDGVVVVPNREQTYNPILHIGGSAGDSRLSDTIIIPGPNTEERTVQSVVSDTEE